MGAERTPPRPSAVVLRSELRQLLRDRRVLFVAVVLPALLYPVLFLGQGKLGEMAEEGMAAREVKVAIDLAGVPEELARELREGLLARAPLELVERDAGELVALEARAAGLDPARLELERRAAARALFGGDAHLLLWGRPAAERPRVELHAYYDVKDELAREAHGRVRALARELEERLAAERRRALLGGDPGARFVLRTVDLASGEDARGAALGRLLPLLAVFVLLTGGSYAALAVFAGEREAGTLETLLVQPVRAAVVARGKFLAVLSAALATLLVNLASLVATLALGFGEIAGVATGGGVGALRLLGGIVYFPGVLLLCAALALVCGRARSFREGQTALLPLTLLALAPTLIVLQPDVELDLFWAAVPLAGPALALKDALVGTWRGLPLAVMVASHALYSGLLLARLATLLDAERVFESAATRIAGDERERFARRALAWGFAILIAQYVIGGRLQAHDPAFGLAASLWILVLGGGLLCARGTARLAGIPFASALGLARPAPAQLAGALLLAPGLVALAKAYLPWQQEVLPLPRSAFADSPLLELFTGMGPLQLFLLLALTPGICEELAFRGAILESQRRGQGPVRVVLWQALLFGAAHASVHRLIPTAVLGAAFAALTLRTRSVWPAILCHVAYDALLVLGERLPWAGGPFERWLPLVALPGLLLLLAPPRIAQR